ncbi:capsule biosynthesis phosphatase [Fusarium denticulatum]|uniref:Mannose-1-phosphate guanyltransferase n=1 Tax=Fusarium denticulatum TaxID=48507 RepID=A0A8H5X4S8_9HYPO|nr:capsule biosynthesis phosphatase [Fusarium denticulatum]
MPHIHDNAVTNGINGHSDDYEPVNVIIPIGGIGSRFAKEGYRFPKPLINIVGQPMLLWLIDNLSLRPKDTLWIAVNEQIDHEFRIGQLVSKNFPKVNMKLLLLRHQTKGASETLYMVTQSMTKQHLQHRTVSLDCDTIYWNDILSSVRKLPSGHGGCFYFIDQGDKPIFSYIQTENESPGAERIVDIQEKKAISNKANTGAYVFPSAADLKIWAAENLDVKHPDGAEVGEYYTSQVISMMVQSGVPFIGLPLQKKDFAVVGTPEQLQELLAALKKDNHSMPATLKKRRFCFDLDMTLVGVPAVSGDYSTCPPISKNIRLVQQLYKAGHYIIIQTARRMKTHSGNPGRVLADVGLVTFKQLSDYEIPYHEINFGKPYADVYVDDLAVNANLDTARELGWILDEPEVTPRLGQVRRSSAEDVKKAGMIAARDFNTVQIIRDKVIKSSKSEAILGELYFYAHMPPTLSRIFPAVYSVDYIPATSTYSITMENRRGRTFSHLLVGRSITKGRLTKFLETLHTIHTAPNTTSQPVMDVPEALDAKFAPKRPGDHPINIYANYGTKLRSRYFQHRDRYDALGPLAASLFARLDEFLDTYEAEEKGVHANVIHGDPVFSNAIISDDERTVSFIDVRCQLENYLTPEGDINYDLGKVLQSLCGYDYILFMSANNYDLTGALEDDKPLLDEADIELLNELQEQFFDFLKNNYSVRLHRKTLFRVTASLFFSLIPLHRKELGALPRSKPLCQNQSAAHPARSQVRFWAHNLATFGPPILKRYDIRILGTNFQNCILLIRGSGAKSPLPTPLRRGTPPILGGTVSGLCRSAADDVLFTRWRRHHTEKSGLAVSTARNAASRACSRRNEDCQYPQNVTDETTSPSDRSTLLPEGPSSVSATSGVLFDLQDMKLLRHWITSTSQKIAKGPEICNFWHDTATTVALQHPFVLQQVLSLAALHVAYLNPAGQSEYIVIAAAHHTRSLQGFQSAISQCNDDIEEGSGIFLWSLLNLLYVFSIMGRFGRDSDTTIEDRRARVLGTNWIPLTRGITSIFQGVKPAIHSDTFQVLRRFGGCWENLDPKKVLCEEDKHFVPLAEIWEDNNDKATYDETLKILRKCYAFTNLFETRDTQLEMTSEWTSHNRVTGPVVFILKTPEHYFELLRQRQPAAIVLFSFFGALMHTLQDCWAMEGWGKDIVSVTDDLLGEYWRPWISWPLQVVQLG